MTKISSNSKIPVFVVCVLATISTAAYCLASGFICALWTTLIVDPAQVSLLSVYTIKPLFASPEYALAHWHFLALVSLVANSVWGWKISQSAACSKPLFLPFCCHISWLLFAFLGHVAGAIASVVAIAHVL